MVDRIGRDRDTCCWCSPATVRPILSAVQVRDRTNLPPGGARTLPISPKGRALPAYLGAMFPNATAVFQPRKTIAGIACLTQLFHPVGGTPIRARYAPAVFSSCCQSFSNWYHPISHNIQPFALAVITNTRCGCR